MGSRSGNSSSGWGMVQFINRQQRMLRTRAGWRLLCGIKLWFQGEQGGGLLKSKLPFMAAWEEKLGFVREEQIRLRVSTAWVMRRSHSWDGKLGSQEASPTQRWFLNVKITCSAALRKCLYGGTSWKLTLYL